MLPDRTIGVDAIVVRRTVDAPRADVVELLAGFAERHKLDLDRRHDQGLLFRAEDSDWNAMFRTGDTLAVTLTETGDGLEVVFAADMGGLRARGDAWKRRNMIRGGVLSALLIGAGVAGFANGVNPGDFIPIGLGAVFMARRVRRVQGEADSRDRLERRVANELHALADELGALD